MDQLMKLLPLALAVLVASYAAKDYDMPELVKNLINNPLFKLVFLALFLIPATDANGSLTTVSYLNKMPALAVFLAIMFLLTMHYANKQYVNEGFAHIESFQDEQDRYD